MSDFKVGKGDRVRLTTPLYGMAVGHLGTVEKVDRQDNTALHQFDGDDLGYWVGVGTFAWDYIEPAPEPSAPLTTDPFQGIDRGQSIMMQQALASAEQIQQSAFQRGMSYLGFGQLSQQQVEAQARGNQQGQDHGLGGDWVRAPEFAALKAERDALRNELQKLTDGRFRPADLLAERDTLRAHVARLEKALDLAQRRGRR